MNVMRVLFLFISICCGASLTSNGFASINYEEIVSLEKAKWVLLSPSGSKVAFCTSQGVLQQNQNVESCYFFDRDVKRQTKIFQADQIKQAVWGNDEKSLYVLVQEGNKHKIIILSDKEESVLIESMDPIPLFTLSSDNAKIYYTVIIKDNDPELMQNDSETGHVFNPENEIFDFILTHTHLLKDLEEIRALDLISGKSDLITHLSHKNWFSHLGAVVESLQVSEDGNYLLMCVKQLGQPDLGSTPVQNDVMVWDLSLGEWYEPLKDPIDVETTPCWVDGKKFVFQQISFSAHEISIWLFDVNARQGNKLDWLSISEIINHFHWDKKNQILYGIGQECLYKISLKEKHVDEIKLPKIFHQRPSIDQQVQSLGYVAESSNEPPEVAIYDLNAKQTTLITHLNPLLNTKALGKVEPISIETSSGIVSNGYLVHPVGEQKGKRYPIIIATYGFEGRFITDAEWHSSFPAQTFAGEGYLVLLLNAPESNAQNLINDPQKSMQMEGWNRLELFEHAVDQLSAWGLGDPTKVGIYGWSNGAFTAEFLMAHSKKFHVACIGAGGDYNPGSFWAGGTMAWPKICVNMFGGPPWGSSLENYLGFSPFFNVDKIRAPLLMEFADREAKQGLEMFIPLRYLKVPAELVIYKNEEHNFVQPKARVASMARKLEWFNYWLFDKRNSDFKKIEQYQRWDTMKEEAKKQRILK